MPKKHSLSNAPKTAAELEARRGGKLCCLTKDEGRCIGCGIALCREHVYYIMRCWDCKDKKLPILLED